jgi:hypothetical protein
MEENQVSVRVQGKGQTRRLGHHDVITDEYSTEHVTRTNIKIKLDDSSFFKIKITITTDGTEKK